ncbi:MAG: PEP-CTERM sorting domain-containing protein [Myxacorys californica WJT36-NPBG1]|jgi:hypothetical protein|nr:PEP-CTERM sorting domain-containing protein [Myxacorys californica WJT36-NPBG1]
MVAQPSMPTVALGASIAWFVQGFAAPVLAADMSFGNAQIRFGEDTTLESSFLESHGAYQSTFGVLNLDTNEKTPLLVESRAADQAGTIFQPSSKISDLESANDFSGTPGNTVSQSSAKYTFKAKTNYAFYLESSYNGRSVGTVYSSDVLNPNQERQVQFSDTDMTSLCQGGSVLLWDDTGSNLVRDRQQQDRDYDDFVVQLRNTACPVGGGELLPSEPQATTASGGAVPPVSGGQIGNGLFFALPLVGLAALAALDGDDNNSNKRNSMGSGGAPPGIIPQPPGQAVPEPFTILGSTTAIGLAALAQRRRSKKRK